MDPVFGVGGGYEFCQPKNDEGAGNQHRRARQPAGDSLRQWAGTDLAAFSGLCIERKIELVHIQPGREDHSLAKGVQAGTTAQQS